MKIRPKKRNSQITAFIMLGLVILVIFIFVFYIKGQVQRQRMEQEIDVIADVLQKTPALNYYVGLCLKDSVESGLILAGKQGGNIYKEQGGIIDRDSVPIFKYKDDNITYGLTSADTNIPNAQKTVGEPGYPAPPGYPCIQAVPAISYECSYAFLFNPVKFFPFSQSHLPLLCIPGGPNDVAMDIYPFPCPSGSYGTESIQEQLKAYAEARMQNCTNFSVIKQMVGFNITADKPEIMPIMGENDVIVKAVYPINITVGAYGSVRLIDFEVKIPVRLKRIYGLARFLADNEKGYLDFNMTEDYDSDVYYTPFWDPYIRVEKFCPKCSPAGDEKDTTDILQINDSASNIMGNDYYFRFAVENRIPALDWVHRTAPEENQFDYIVQEGDEIIIEPMGYDPDDTDDMYYSYEGWKQDYDEVFDPGCCNEINPGSGIICKNEPWKCIRKAPAAGLQLCMDDYAREDLNVWTTSQLYLIPQNGGSSNTYRSSNYMTRTTKQGAAAEQLDDNPVYYPCIKDGDGNWQGTAYSRDLGPHNVTVNVSDGHGKSDWQSVLIMVTDIPKPVIEITNDFGTADASLEDPFTLDASKSNIFSVVDRYLWKAFVPGAAMPVFTYDIAYSETQNGRIRIPSNYDIMNIKGKGDFFADAGTHTLELTIGSQTATKNIEVKECIPFAGSYPPYPYNPEVADPFMASHTCCNPDYTLVSASAERECYSKGQYGSLLSFASNDFIDPTLPSYQILYDLGAGTFTETRPLAASDYGNDVFYREFKRLCSGDRGNTCTGTAKEIRHAPLSTPQKQCNDFDVSILQDERCQGPPKGIFDYASESNCINYPVITPAWTASTFESDYGVNGLGGSANGRCSDMDKCTNAVDFRQDGKFWCADAVCDGSGYCSRPYAASQCYCSVICGASPSCVSFNYGSLGSGQCTASGFCTSGCQFQSPDDSGQACGCSGNHWQAGGEVPGSTKCCGDDAGEYYIQNIYDTSPDNDACCNALNECVLGGICQNRPVGLYDICNGIDDDCNPLTEDGSGETAQLNSKLYGVCMGSRKSCHGAAGWEDDYSDVLYYEETEISCNDNKDNDCDSKEDCQDSGCAAKPVCQST